MRVCQLEINNFRGIQTATLVLPEHAVLFGRNNVGKSTIIEALALLFERERLARQLSDWDFVGGAPRPESRFTIIGTITDFADAGSDEPENFPKWFAGNAATPIWWIPDSSLLSREVERPLGGRLAVQVALTVRYEEQSCEFEPVRYYYHGPCDPFTDDVVKVPVERLQEIGMFLLPSNRQWDKLLSFGSSSFLKVLKSVDAIPGVEIEALKAELRDPDTKLEENATFAAVLQRAEAELRAFLMLDGQSRLVYRPTSLDSMAVLQSLVPHIIYGDQSILPFARHGAGMVSLQAFLIVLAFAERRKAEGKNFMFAAEEPELHLHPSLHRKLANRIRSLSTQSIVTPHSPLIAASYPPAQSLFVSNAARVLSVQPIRGLGDPEPAHNTIRNLYRRHREAFYEALMGGAVFIPEGQIDFEWLRLWQRVAEATDDAGAQRVTVPLTFIPTSDAAVADTYLEISRFRKDAVPLVDGDAAGLIYVTQMEAGNPIPARIVRYGEDAAAECMAAWILEPSLAAPGTTLNGLIGADHTLRNLQTVLCRNEIKSNPRLHEELAWEAGAVPDCASRASQLIEDLGRIATGIAPQHQNWERVERPSGATLFTAAHIRRV